MPVVTIHVGDGAPTRLCQIRTVDTVYARHGRSHSEIFCNNRVNTFSCF